MEPVTGASGELRIFEDAEQLAAATAEAFVRRADSAVRAGGRFTAVLSGGSTPRRLFKRLAAEPYRNRAPWDAIHLFWADERTVPPDHPDSNYAAAANILLSKLDLPAGNVHRIPAERSDPEKAAAAYAAEIRRFFQLEAGQVPRFDLILLGMGTDGHTASLFPGTRALQEIRRLAVANWVENREAWRITLTRPVFEKAACIRFLVAGADKAATLRRVLEGPPGRFPAQLIRPRNGELSWYVDRAAATALSRTAGA